MKRFFVFILFLVILSSSNKAPQTPVEKPKEKKIQTRPAPYFHKRKRMIASEPIIVAIVDTGLQYSKWNKAKLCDTGHFDFTAKPAGTFQYGTKDPVPNDDVGHGTNIAGLITEYAGDGNYCLVILRYYSAMSTGNDNLKNTIKAFKYAVDIGAKVINYSGGGTESDKEESDIVKKFLDNGGIFVAAAGNESANLKDIPYYPAMDDDRIVVVGNGTSPKDKHSRSNYGDRVNVWEDGRSVSGFGIRMTGTSQATAIATGKIIKKTLDSISK